MKIDFSNNTLIVTLYDDSNLWKLLKSVSEIERFLHQKLSIDFNGTTEVLIDVIDYFEYTSLRKLLLDFCHIY